MSIKKWIENMIFKMAFMEMKRKLEAQGFYLSDKAIETLVKEALNCPKNP